MDNSYLYNVLLDTYAKLQYNYSPYGVDFGTYNTPVNFRESMNVPMHRWYGYKEGFSPSFVREFFNRYKKSSNDVVFDPFSGVGTSGLEANLLGFKAYLMDVNPLGLFVSKVKTRHYSETDVKSILKEIHIFENVSDCIVRVCIPNTTILRYFDSLTWNSILKIKTYILEIENNIVKDIFNLSLLSLIEEISTHHKNGNGVKRKRKMPTPLSFVDLRTLVINRLFQFIEDINGTQLKSSSIIYSQSNIDEYILPEKVDMVLTSPPYANCFDYSKVYLTELWVGDFFKNKQDQTDFRERSLISHVHYRWTPRNMPYSSNIVDNIIAPILNERKLWSKNIVPMLKGYFSDMGKFLSNLAVNLNSNSTIGIVVGNSVYGGVPIATDLIIANKAEDLGYSVEEIKVYRKVIASSQQMVILSDLEKGYIRESLIVLKWKN